jgi:hypothetical protein
MKRWIIRSFFIGLLLIVIGAWVRRYQYSSSIRYSRENYWDAASSGGRVHLGWVRQTANTVYPPGFMCFDLRQKNVQTDADRERFYDAFYFLGFGLHNKADEQHVLTRIFHRRADERLTCREWVGMR